MQLHHDPAVPASMPALLLPTLVAHPVPLVAAGIAAALGGSFHVDCIDVRRAAQAVDTCAAAGQPVLLITDHATALQLAADAAGHGHDVLRVPHRRAGWRLLVVAQETRAWAVRSALQAGIHGYLSADCSLDELRGAVAGVQRGQRYLCPVASACMAESVVQTPLTPREMDVLQLLSAGLDNKTISLRLEIALGTVKSHVKAVLEKLAASSRTHAVAAAHARGLVMPADAPLAACRRPVVRVAA